MKNARFFILSMVVFWLGLAAPPVRASIFIHEILADPPSANGDANRDGITSSLDDEFIELFNKSSDAVDISGWSISDAVRVRHVFAENTWIGPSGVFLVFGGGNPSFDSLIFQIASTGGLSLNNTGDVISLYNRDSLLIDQWIYGSEGNRDQSLVRNEHGVWLHSEISPGISFSPGVYTDYNPNASVVDETPTWLSLLIGVAGFGIVKKRVMTENIYKI